MELTASYHYLSAASYFGRDDVALKGFEVYDRVLVFVVNRRHFLPSFQILHCLIETFA